MKRYIIIGISFVFGFKLGRRLTIEQVLFELI